MRFYVKGEKGQGGFQMEGDRFRLLKSPNLKIGGVNLEKFWLRVTKYRSSKNDFVVVVVVVWVDF